ncbi:S41 family peptidase [Phenylobacterium sp.]|uniref:S41 family peptidase n=1 Tax=Phenylobacterium sp. TaxID=1871053 RepID=UPI00301D340A
MKKLVTLMLALAAGVAAHGVAAGEPAVQPRAVQADLDALYLGLQAAHYDLFAHRTRAEYDQFHKVLSEGAAKPMDRLEAEVLLQRFTAFGRVGHARIDAPMTTFVRRLGEGGRFLPLFIRVDEGRVRLTAHADAEGRLAPGFELLTLEGEPIAVWLERAGALISAERPYMTHALLEQAFPPALWLLLGEVGQVEVTGRDPEGRLVRAKVRSITAAERRELTARAPRLAVDFAAREFRMLEGGVGYLRPGPFGQTSGEAPDGFHRFIDESFGRLLDAGAKDLILDLRNNPGGDNGFSDPMVAWFADGPFRFASSFRLRASPQAKAWYRQRLAGGAGDPMLLALARAEAAQPDGARYDFDLPLNPPRPAPRFEGKVHVLVNRHSYSNAASVAALIQDYGFGEVMGEETADVPTTYASVLSFTLPSGVDVTYPKSRIVRPNGDERLRGVRPDHPLAREPIATATDTVLEEALLRVRGPRD